MSEAFLPYNFFWVDEAMAGSAHPGRDPEVLKHVLENLKAQGFGLVVSLAPLDSEAVQEAGLDHVYLSVPDMGIPDKEQLLAAVKQVEEKRSEGKKILVHCGAGYGRTGTFIACFLVYSGIGSDEAISRVRRKQPGAIETRPQEAFIHRWAEETGSK